MCTMVHFHTSKLNVAYTLVLVLLGLQSQTTLASVGFFAKSTYASVAKSAVLSNSTQPAGADLSCEVAYRADSTSDKLEACPKQCPYWSSNTLDEKVCTFVCTTADSCPKWNPRTPMADTVKKSRTCRGPRVEFCDEYNLDGTDSCKTCMPGYKVVDADGQCYFDYWGTLYGSVAFTLFLVGLLAAWVIDWCRRPTVNEEELLIQEVYASRCRVLQSKAVDGHRRPYPIDTNLCKEDVAGLGMLLHFRFQVLCIVWPLFIALFWAGFAIFHEELWIIGTRRFGTPRHNCILVAWGYETQQRLMWTKVCFLAITYLFSFVVFLAYGVMQLRTYQEKKATETTMMDFAAELSGLPDLPGTQDIEKDLKKAVQDATGKPVVGVSIAWRYGNYEDNINQALKDDAWQKDQIFTPRAQQDLPDPTANMGMVRKKLYNMEKLLVGPAELDEDKSMNEILSELVTSETAFVVFQYSDDVEAAIEKCQDTGIPFQGTTLKLRTVDCEPPTINWQNYNDTGDWAPARNAIKGFFKYYVPGLLIWFFVFYYPYAWSLYNFNYENGQELPAIYGLVFTMVVVVGNATMYQVCDLCSEEMSFKCKDTKQCVYMLMYTFACMFNVLLDMAITYKTVMKMQVGLGFRTYHGTKLEDIEHFTVQFETYAMQRALGENTFIYAFPSTFLIPFLIEPFVTVVLPYRLGVLFTRTHTEVRGPAAEVWMRPWDFDAGRYADILLNVFLGILIFYFPGGYNFTLFVGMCISHAWIYIFDHWRVLRAIPNITINTYSIEWWAQAMLAGCCAIILSALVFKANCESYSGYCLHDMELISLTTAAGAGHFVVHMLLLIYVVPAVAGNDFPDQSGNVEYKTVAENEAYSWFSVNPVHCLRSKFIHKHKPYCRLAENGKEHLLEVNPQIGCYFTDTAAEVKDSEVENAEKIFKRLSERMHSSLTSSSAAESEEAPKESKDA